MFSEELSGLPQVREVEFSIEFQLGIGPISMASYRLAHVKLIKLKKQLVELQSNGFIR